MAQTSCTRQAVKWRCGAGAGCQRAAASTLWRSLTSVLCCISCVLQVFVPFLVFGCLAVLGGLLTLLMPETSTAGMPETMGDLANLLSGFTAKPWRQGFATTITFLFRTKAAEAYSDTSRGSGSDGALTATGSSLPSGVLASGPKAGSLPRVVADLIAAEVVGGSCMEAGGSVDSSAAVQVAIRVCDGSDVISVEEGAASSTGSVHSSTPSE